MSGNLLIQDRPSVPNMPATQITQLNPEVRNRNLLNTMFKVSLKHEMCLGYALFDSDHFLFSSRKTLLYVNLSTI